MCEKKFFFLKSIPNSLEYWSSKKKDVFAMIRQLGKPAIFFTFSASEYRWPRLFRILYRKEWPGTDENLLTEMSPTERTNLVNDDPVTCCLFFNKLIDTI